MGSLHAFEMNLKQRKKEKTIAFKSAQEKAKNTESHRDDEEYQLILLTKNFHKFLKKAGKQTKYGVFVSKASKVKIISNILIFLTRNVFNIKCKGYGHIQSECTNTHKKKSKAMTSIQSDEDPDGSQEEDDNNVSHISFTSFFNYNDNLALRKATKSVVTDLTKKFVATDENCNNAGNNSDNGVESKTDEEPRRDAYENIYGQWLRVCDENHALISENAFLIDLKDKSEKKMQVLETLVTKKEDRIKELSFELERTQKNLKMLNLDSTQLDQILFKGKYIGNQQGLGFKGECSNSKTIFVKSNSMTSYGVVSLVLENRKLAANSVATENTVEAITTEQKSRI